ncbi:MAG: UvrD-helicase domain-containing protein, partial [Chrysiogenetes bacterium]|nr:UvrD-helicase domain-containing protein [Chrysiogenetes bacterium]
MSGLSFEQGLNPEQAEAVRSTEGPLLILAGAGSGKTRVITFRIAHLIQDLGVDPWAIYAVTFTNKAAEQMRARLDSLLGGMGYGGLWISTFHSSCVRILRNEIHHLGYEPHFVIYDDKEQKQLIKEVLKELDLSEKVVDPRMVAGKFDQLKNQGYLPDDEWEMDFGFGEERLRQIYKRYQERLKQMNALDFGDLLVQTTRLFEQHDEVRAQYARQFEYVLVDEYQDTNKVQYKLIQQLTREHQNVCVVGDDDQSIYKWRGADITNIFNFERDYPGTKVIKLEQNYRSTQNILKVANAVISHNTARKGKQLWSAIEGGALVTHHHAEDEHAEARFIVKSARDRVHTEGKGWRDVAIFYRTNAQSRVLEEELLKHRIPYNILGGQKFYDRKEVKDALCYLRLLINPVDDVALLRIINTPTRGIGPGTVEKLQDSAAQQRISLLEATRRACTDGTLGTGPTKK